MIFGFFYWFSDLTEKHLKIVTNTVRVFNILITLLTLVNYYEFPIFNCVLLTVGSGFLTYLIFNGYPKIRIDRRDYILALVLTLVNHFIWMIYYFSNSYPATIVLTTFVVFIWFNPITIVSSIVKYDEHKRGSFLGFWKSLFLKMENDFHQDMARMQRKQRKSV
ncbi:hypothetical protein TVAG_178110 [Trichomonas vaginalis G3]|uniref:Uncharacterized protein n=1 Tax=Trichomonas vaginalis (strain ATCC PRA-98 / G3) TaxID=412133 RepID=A2DIG3_TRIV3|nr:TEX261 protein family [Trichomonas vaginalis G3]EAY19767.1 hypothetical protein TVAG_178110 [Trichomonas vaginalis G3]KAI5523936.1 TEX261 protein family [Trichomonas vaginalis G3]|eukprot:XP_001580753.1 hypothetical protein [Trichomonas vaginalis G3]